MLKPNLIVTAAAQKFIRRMVRFSDRPDGGMRLSVTPGGCSGYSSEFRIEAGPGEGESELQVDGARLFLPAESRLLLDGVTMDFVDTPTRSGLTFFNPAAAACACSTSGAGEGAAPPPRATIPVASIGRMPTPSSSR